MFALQNTLNERILGEDVKALYRDRKAEWILNYARALQQELAELVDSVPWKWWAHYQKFDEQNARVEIVDMMHFLISLAQVMGMDAQALFEAYVKKNAVNHDRQNKGYLQKERDDTHV
jgi:dimeric dUTPase (all-alpha-NTP-PPase superfamily)